MAWEHPELKKGEVFIGNVTGQTFYQSRWKTKRLGKVAYKRTGEMIEQFVDDPNDEPLFPMFVSKEEVEIAKKK